jgi:hypothetical protein
VPSFCLVSEDWYQFTVRDACNLVSDCFLQMVKSIKLYLQTIFNCTLQAKVSVNKVR